MTRPALTAIVESAARQNYERLISGSGGDDAPSPWDDLGAMHQHHWREIVLPIVTATLRALAPLADDWDARAQKAYRDARRAIERAENAETTNDAHKHAEKAHGHQSRGDALAAVARELRGVITP